MLIHNKKTNGFRKLILATCFVAGGLTFHNEVSANINDRVEPLAGFGNNVPLSFAIKQIVPPNYGVFFGENVDQSQKISWTGGGTWNQILDRTVSVEGLIAEVIGDKVIITNRSQGNVSYTQSKGYPSETETLRTPGMLVRPYAVSNAPVEHKSHGEYRGSTSPVPPPRPISQAPHHDSDYVDPFSTVGGDYRGHEEHVEYRAPPQRREEGYGYSDNSVPPQDEDAVSLSTPISAQKEWIITSGLTLQEILSDWTEEAGWSLVWDSSYEYPIEADAVFYGPFIDRNEDDGSLIGAAADLISSMKNARPIVNADFYMKNKVMVVSTSTDDHN